MFSLKIILALLVITVQASTTTSTSTTTVTLGDPSTTTINYEAVTTERADAYGTCGGEGYVGPSHCVLGYYCQAKSSWYSQCRPINEQISPIISSTSIILSSSAPNNVIPIVSKIVLPSSTTTALNTAVGTGYAQCGGEGWAGPTECASGYVCRPNSVYYSQCLPTSEQASSHLSVLPSNTLAPTSTTSSRTSSSRTTSNTGVGTGYAQCGGEGWFGLTRCAAGFYCRRHSIYYSQCRPNSEQSSSTKATSKVSTTSSVGSSSKSSVKPTPTFKPTSKTSSKTLPPTAVGTGYAQCGGEGWTGPTKCVAGFFCRPNSVYYSQCRPSSEQSTQKSSVKVSIKPTENPATTFKTMLTSSSRSIITPTETSPPSPPTAFNPITRPVAFQIIPAGKVFKITWTPSAPYGKISLYLLQGPTTGTLQYGPIIVKGIQSTAGSYSWNVPKKLSKSAIFGILLKLDSNPDVIQYSNPFNISGLGATAPTKTTESTPSPSLGTKAGAYEQCAGQGWPGPKSCIDGYSCVATSVFYSNCKPL